MSRQVTVIAALVAAALCGPVLGTSAAAADDPPPGTIGGAPSAQAQEQSTLTWSVRPTPREGEENRPNYLLDVEPGQVVEDSIRVRNFGKTELPLTLYASDARTTETGAIDLLPAGERPKDVGAWIDLEKSELRIAPEEFVDIPFTMTVPDNAESGDHVGGIVTSYIAPGSDETGQPVKLDRRLGTRVQVRVAGELRPGLTITSFNSSYGGTVNPAGKGDMTVTYTVTNTGNVRMSAQQFLEVDGPLGLTGVEADLNPMPELLPGNSLTMTSRISGVWPILRASSELEVRPIPTRPGDNFPALQSAYASSGNWTMPWTLILFLLAIAGGTAGTVLMRRQQQAREDARVDEKVRAELAGQGAAVGGDA
jgi:hypothetical protein